MEITNNIIVPNKPIIEQKQQVVAQSPISANIPTSYDSQIANQAIKNSYASTVQVNSYKELPSIKFPYINPAKVYELSNGQKVIIVPKKDSPTVIRTYFKTGSFNEPDNLRGISHFIEHNLFNGSKNLAQGEFVDKVSEMGGRYNASTGFLTTDYFIKTALLSKDDLKKTIELHADMLKHPTFDEKALEKEKNIVSSEIQMLADNPGNLAINTLIKNLFNIKSTSSDLIGGHINNIKNLTREDVLNYYNTHYTPENMTTVIVGDINSDEAIKLINKEFNTGKVASSTEPKYYEDLSNVIQKTVRQDLTSNQVQSPVVNLAFVGPKNNNIKDELTSRVFLSLSSGFESSKLSKAIKPFNTSPSASREVIGTKLDDPQVILFQAQFNKGDEQNGLNTIYKALFEMSQVPVSEKELAMAKNMLKDELANVAENSMDISSIIGQSITHNGDPKSYSEALNILDSITTEDIKNFAKKYIDLNKTSIVVLHPEAKKDTIQVSFTGNSVIGDVKSSVKEYNLRNNMRFVANNTDSQHLSSITELKLTQVPSVKPGVPELLSQILNDGTKHHSKEQLEEIMVSNNIACGINIGKTGLDIRAKAPKDKAKMAIGIGRELLVDADITNEKLEKAKKQFKLALAESIKNPYGSAIDILYSSNQYKFSGKKILENIDSITIDDLKTFHNTLLTQSYAITTVSAPMASQKNLFNEITNALAEYPQATKEYSSIKPLEMPELTSNKVSIIADDKNQAHIVQMFRVKESGNTKDKAALMILNQVLGADSSSRLFTDLREKQNIDTYRVGSSLNSGIRSGELTLEIMTTTQDKANNIKKYENIQKAIDGFKKNINLLINEPISQKELENAKLAIKSRLVFATESTFDKNTLLSSSYETAYGKEYIEELTKAIDSMTAVDIQKAAKIFLDKPSVTSILASQETLDANKEYIKSLGELV